MQQYTYEKIEFYDEGFNVEFIQDIHPKVSYRIFLVDKIESLKRNRPIYLAIFEPEELILIRRLEKARFKTLEQLMNRAIELFGTPIYTSYTKKDNNELLH